MQAKFPAPFDFPLGSYDVGLVLNGRTDTAFLMQGVRILGLGTPTLLSVTPNKGGLNGFEAVIRSEFVTGDLSLYDFTLRKGTAVIPANRLWGNEGFADVYFQVPRTADTGLYDLQAELGASVLRMPGAVRIMPPEIGALTPPALRAGKAEQFEFDIRYPDFDVVFDSLPPEGPIIFTPNFKRVRLCRGTECMEGQVGEFGNHGVAAKFSLPAAQTPGLYDLEVTSLIPDRALTKKAAVLVSPPGLASFAPWYIRPGEAYFILSPDSLFSFSFQDYYQAACQNKLKLAPAQAPAGMSFSQGTLAWTPAKADTGWHFISLIPAAADCPEGYYLALQVKAHDVTAIHVGNAGGIGAGRNAVWSGAGSDFRIRLDRQASVEIRSTDGRLLGRYRHLEAGVHTLSIPGGRSIHGLILCRIRQPGGDSWLRLLR